MKEPDFFFHVWSLTSSTPLWSEEKLQTVRSACYACGNCCFSLASLRSKEIDSSDLVRIKGRVQWSHTAPPQPPIQIRLHIQV